jgi:uncharacterized protein YdbL (DUF1318 family)
MGDNKMKKFTIRVLLFLLPVIMLYSGSVLAQGIKERMKERLPVIVELKNNGIIGENSEGYLEFIGSKKENENIIDAENNDRKLIYEAIAERENTTAEKVGKRRAQQIAEKADPGEWLKNEKGKWYKK